MMHVLARTVSASTSVVRRLRDRHFRNTKTKAGRQNRDDPLFIPIEVELFEHRSAHGAGAASEITKAQPCDEVNKPVKRCAPNLLERVAGTRRSIADRDVCFIEGGNQLVEMVGINLMIGR